MKEMKKIGILCAGDSELAPFLPLIEEGRETQKAMLKFYEGKIAGVEIVTLFSGVCKVNAAIASQILIDTYGVDAIINAGVAGGMSTETDVFDVVISTEIAYHDVDAGILTEFHPWMESVFFQADEKLLDLSRTAVSNLETASKIHWGRMVTGEAFIAEEGRQNIVENFAPLSVDMETASVAHVCHVNRIPFLAIRCLTDSATNSASDDFMANCEKATCIAKDITVALLKEIHSR